MHGYYYCVIFQPHSVKMKIDDGNFGLVLNVIVVVFGGGDGGRFFFVCVRVCFHCCTSRMCAFICKFYCGYGVEWERMKSKECIVIWNWVQSQIRGYIYIYLYVCSSPSHRHLDIHYTLTTTFILKTCATKSNDCKPNTI